MEINILIVLKFHALRAALPAKLEAQVTGVSLLTRMGSVNIFVQIKDIVEMDKLTKLVMTVVAVKI